MQTTYRVQSGDTLSAIAVKHQTSIAELQAINPQITNKDHIQIGWELKIPANGGPARANGSKTLRSPRSTNNQSKGQASCRECSEEYTEIIHITGASDDEWCVALPESAAKELLQEVELVDGLMAEFKEAQNTNYDPQYSEPSPKRRWMQKAEKMGVIAPSSDEREDDSENKASQISSQIAAIDEQIKWYKDYDSDYLMSYVSDDAQKREDVETAAKEKRLAMLREERQTLVRQLEEGSASSGVKGNGVKSSDFLASHGNTTEKGIVASRRARKNIGVIEIMIASRPGRWHYIRREAYQRLVTTYASVRYVKKTRAIANTLKNKSATGSILAGQILEGISADAAKSLAGNIGITFAETSDQHYLLGEEHSKLTWSSGGDESPVENNFQVSAEAHLMRFAMQASAGVNAFDLSTGEIDIGTKASATMALLEAEIKLAEVFVPQEAGWDCRFTYRNRNGELTDMAFGAFRFSGDITLNCFAGGRGSGEASARLSSGAASFLLSDKKKVEASPTAGLAVTGNAFAGAEAGGAVGGQFSWVHPSEQYKNDAAWQNLFKISAGGTLALGAGAGFDFQLKVVRNAIVLVCKGRLVFGPGASGSFGSEIGADKIWNLAKTVFEVLSAADYHFLANIDEELFSQWTKALYLKFTDDTQNLLELLTCPALRFDEFWMMRKERKKAAEALSIKIISHAKSCSSLEELNLDGLPYSQLPPEALGAMMHTLSETFLDSWEENQEKALLILTSQIKTWRQFFETLEHMSPDGSKVNPMGSLRTLVAILDDGASDSQLSQFHRWITSDLAIKPSKRSLNLAWTPIPIKQKGDRLAIRIAKLNESQREIWA
ncbi:LysM peptidoglycan-binding domain-containing protein [Marinobacter sp. AL4B]|uniref:LysM peptidoglycan-binding domain-containing protein n=1 Tax=Marinobacter sp. AL4B TaxID=2871173 RepID=UPI001CAA767A|nr:LysM domain-containing protein [Marinobacter sp. AL4B]MBZ0334219.1 LysM peptidoglycan-binding domain-containing protein [Marinobacter sp. AL4B]